VGSNTSYVEQEHYCQILESPTRKGKKIKGEKKLGFVEIGKR